MGLCKTGVKPKSALLKLLHGHKYALSLDGLLHIVNAQNVCPFSSETVCSTVVPFSEVCGVPPSSLYIIDLREMPTNTGRFSS